jgi:hypothetical protein
MKKDPQGGSLLMQASLPVCRAVRGNARGIVLERKRK